MSQQSGIQAVNFNILRRSLEKVLFTKRPARGTTKWVLRNHTALQSVHLKVRRRRNSQINDASVKGVPWLSLDKALMLRICWGGANMYGIYDEKAAVSEKVARGSWAGHCFDVVESKELGANRGLQDVTAEIVQEAKALKKAFADA